MINAFEKILERLNRKAIPVLDEDEHIIPESNIKEPYEIDMVALSDAIKIVQEVAEEYNGPAEVIQTVRSDRLDCEVPSDYFEDITEVRVIDEYTEETKIFKEVNRWIPCSEMLPEDGVPVLLQDSEGYYSLGVSETNRNIKGFRDGDWWGSANNYKAWQPLPEPYEESEDIARHNR